MCEVEIHCQTPWITCTNYCTATEASDHRTDCLNVVCLWRKSLSVEPVNFEAFIYLLVVIYWYTYNPFFAFHKTNRNNAALNVPSFTEWPIWRQISLILSWEPVLSKHALFSGKVSVKCRFDCCKTRCALTERQIFWWFRSGHRCVS